MVPTGDGPTQVERSESGIIRHPSTVYGASQGGNALNVWLPDNEKPAILVMAAMHGDEPETTVVLSEALRAIRRGSLKNAVILSANPDGLCLGTRGNANGVDLNRNFPASNWAPEILFYKSRKAGPRDIAISPGARPASEPETQALLRLIDDLQPLAVITLHAALACIDDPDSSYLARQLSTRTGLPLEPVTYPTPGSFGSWAQERGLSVVTYELEAASMYDLKERHTAVLVDVLTGEIALEEA